MKKENISVKLAVAYCRVSTDLEEQKKSIYEQQKQWLEFFNETGTKSANCGLLCHRQVKGFDKNGKALKGKLVSEPRTDGLYVDEGISGKSMRSRQAFLKMIEDAKLKKFDVIYVEDISRFTRSVEDGLKIIKDLREIGVAVYFRKEGFDSMDTSKEFELQLRMSIAQEESRTKSERMIWAIDRLHKKGGWNSGAPYGYDIVDGFLVINEEQAKAVKLIFDMYVNQHLGYRKICTSLEKLNIETQKGFLWTPPQIRKLLMNTIYKGEQRTHTQQTFDITRNTITKIDSNEQIVFQKEELRIVDDDTFNKAQLLLKERATNFEDGNGSSVKHLFSTLLYCGYCGHSFIRRQRLIYVRKDGTSKEKTYTWVCREQNQYGTIGKVETGRCKGERNAPNETDLLNAVKYDIKQLQKSNLDDIFNLYMAEKFVDIESDVIEELKQKQTVLNAEMRQLRQDRVANLIDEDVYTDSMKQINTDLSNIKSGIARAERINIEKSHKTELFETYKKFIMQVDVENLTNAVLKEIFYKIYIKYRKDENGVKTPYLRFVYRFLDTTDETLLMEEDNNTVLYSSIFECIKEEK